MSDIDDLLIYHLNIILTCDVYDILDNMHKYDLCKLSVNFYFTIVSAAQKIKNRPTHFNTLGL